ncbi:MAG TPA: CHRD domain-containing protein [Chitinophagaceae bacterium]|nr:CHRD domain-containing protein [Chitinophagaceae bacterium]
MKQFYPRLLLLAIKKTLLLLIVFFGASYVSSGQVYWVSLSGPAEAPPNNSPGTGKALITIDAVANTMRVQANFSGLLAGVTASHIHAPTAVAGTGTAGVATTLPTFPGFPAGVTAGTYDQTFNMLLASSYNPSYVTNNGGTTATAFAALRAAISAGKAYLNIHSSMFPGGEIRGFLNLCPTINVSIPDAFALPGGVLANTVYPAYAPASSLMLQANVSGGTGPYNYTWSNGATTSSITVSPTATTTFSVAVQDQNGCPGAASATKTVNVVDVSGGNKGDKIVVCHKGKELTIGSLGVADHLLHGDMLGSCEPVSVRSRSTDVMETEFAIRVLANPSPNHFDIQIRGNGANNIRLTVYDNLGRVIERKSSLPSNQTVSFGSSYRSGIYLVEIVQGTHKQTLKLVKPN